MDARRRLAAWIAGGLLVGAAWPLAVGAFSNVAIGDPVENATLRTLDGKRHDLLSRQARANVFIFFRPGQDRSIDTLKTMVACEKDLAGKPVHWVAVVSDGVPSADVKQVVADTRLDFPVLVDEGDALYGRLGVRLHPVVGVVDGKGKLSAYEPFRDINYCDRVRAEVRFALGEISRADVEKADNPDKSVSRTEEGVARRHVNFAKGLLRIGDADKALEEVGRSLEISPSAAAFGLRAKILASQHKCAEALQAADAALKIDPAEPSALEGRKGCGR